MPKIIGLLDIGKKMFHYKLLDTILQYFTKNLTLSSSQN